MPTKDEGEEPFHPASLVTVMLVISSLTFLRCGAGDETYYPWPDAAPETQPDIQVVENVPDPVDDQPPPDLAPDPTPDLPPAEEPPVEIVEEEQPPPALDYPPGPYGTRVGDRIANLTFFTIDSVNVSLLDFYRDTSRKLLLIYSTAGWCEVCRAESYALPGYYRTYWPMGLAVLAAVFQDDYGWAATQDYARQYALSYGFQFTTAADNPCQMDAYYGEDSMPMNLYVDLSTMTILDIQYGFDAYYDDMGDTIGYYIGTISR
jgi:hypothetical protein